MYWDNLVGLIICILIQLESILEITKVTYVTLFHKFS